MSDSASYKRLKKLAKLVKDEKCLKKKGPFKVGVDLGTANIAIVVVDKNNNPVAGASSPSKVVKDGVVVDYITATQVVSTLKQKVEEGLCCTLDKAATAIPPGVSEGSVKVIVNVVESAGFIVTDVIDEPVAAACALNLQSGAVVDVGGGTTGMSILDKGEVTFSADEPTGGSHMTLVLAGAMDLEYDLAESMKKEAKHEKQVFSVVRPVVEKMASLVSMWLKSNSAEQLWLVGGASSFSEFAEVFTKVTGVESLAVPEPLLVTPLGIAMKASE
ncbi:ethanolamine utilization protein EutJ [Vibrio celticus]|uniref:Chaperone protein DnaK n=1 Tax=Vibrio celticus TaxID=446372 RepID=A0A1C3JEK7_9VIBR|nr:ethanolamine utilization protein EutJ [Vibrio celticus]SBT13508.1 Chaperone protein DnaK [Vibrio celticus]